MIGPGNPGTPSFRVFCQGSTGFASFESVREDAERRAVSFCKRKGKVMNALSETRAKPPFVLGNFPRIEIVFECASKAAPAENAEISDPKLQKLSELKRLLDSGALTQAEFAREKAKLLGGP